MGKEIRLERNNWRNILQLISKIILINMMILPSPPTSGSSRGLFLGVSTDCCGFLSIIAQSLPYSIKCLKATVVVVWHKKILRIQRNPCAQKTRPKINRNTGKLTQQYFLFWNWGCMFGRNFKLNTAYTWIHYYHSPACSAVHIINIHIQYHHTICVLKPDETTEKMNWKRNGDAARAHRVLQLSILKHSLYFCCIKILHILKTGVILSWISHCMDRNTSRNHCL